MQLEAAEAEVYIIMDLLTLLIVAFLIDILLSI